MDPQDFEKLKVQLASKRRLSIELISNSMSPVMPTGTIATIEPVSYDEIRPMDFIVFYQNRMLICHAAWEPGFFKSAGGERTLITRGLASPFFDQPVRESFILGRVTTHRVSRARFYWFAVKTAVLARFGIYAR